MISKEQAAEMGETIVEQAEKEALAQRNLAARRVNPLYRFPELERFEPWRRKIIVDEASSALRKNRSFIFGVVVCIAVVLGVAVNEFSLHAFWFGRVVPCHEVCLPFCRFVNLKSDRFRQRGTLPAPPVSLRRTPAETCRGCG